MDDILDFVASESSAVVYAVWIGASDQTQSDDVRFLATNGNIAVDLWANDQPDPYVGNDDADCVKINVIERKLKLDVCTTALHVVCETDHM